MLLPNILGEINSNCDKAYALPSPDGINENATFYLGTSFAVCSNFTALSGRGSPFYLLEASMEPLRMTIIDGKLHIEGFPDAVAIVRLRSKKARKLADMVLHKADLEFSIGCISHLKALPAKNLVHEALWRSAVIHFIKCFGNSERRGQLSVTTVFSKAPDGAKDWFKYFDDLRNKHFVHDESSHSQCTVGAIINGERQDHKVAKIVGQQITIMTFSEERLEYLDRIVRIAHQWVISHFDDLAGALSKELEIMEKAELASMEPLIFEKPTSEKMWHRDAS